MPSVPDTITQEPIVHIIDDEDSVRAALLDLFESVKMKAAAFASAAEFLASGNLFKAGCILLDLQMPDTNGLDFQAQLLEAGSSLPIVFMSGHGTVPLTVQAMKGGATDFLIKPMDGDRVIAAALSAIKLDAENREGANALRAAQTGVTLLTPREREVLTFVSQGLMNKQIAFEMKISEIMVKLHRGKMMRKMNARTVADLVRMYDRLNHGRPSSVHSRFTVSPISDE